MKKVFLFFSIFMMMGMVSCSKSDDDGSGGNSIFGSWQSVTRSSICTNKTTGEVTTAENYSCTELSFRLYDDGTCQYGSYSGTYKHIGNELNIYYGFDYDALQKDGETYIPKHKDITYNYVIKELSDKRMVLYDTDSWTDSEGQWEIERTTTMEKVN